jgi:uncharacterized protein YkwD
VSARSPLAMLCCALLAVALLLSPAAVAHAAPQSATAASTCSGSDLDPTTADLAAVRAAIVCLHGKIRAQRGLPLLTENARLRRAAVGHSASMVSQRYFDHNGPSGTSLLDRAIDARYVRRDGDWSLGENIAWGTGSAATPASIMRSWMASPGHRANILRRSYREVGVGIVTGVPSGGTAGATYTADFGVRR